MDSESVKKDPKLPESSPLKKIIVVASIAAGSQFCWALQFSLLTPYVQLLGIPHSLASYIWLCGPISGMLVQPTVGYYSDRSTSRFGRRRPFIAAGASAVAFAVILIGYAADLGHLSGDQLGKGLKKRAIAIFVVGFWILDVANNTIQGPCRALLADLSNSDQKKTRLANALFAFFLAVGFVLGYAAGSYSHLYEMLPFTKTKACDVYCANLKTCFFISIALLSTLIVIAFSYVKEDQWSPAAATGGVDGSPAKSAPMPLVGEIYAAVKNFKKPMWILLLVTGLNSTALFPFLLYDTDWVGREVYGGRSDGSEAQVKLYKSGVRVGTLGLMLLAVVLGITSLSVEVMARKLGKVKRLWGIGNFVLAIGLALTILITKLAESNRQYATVNGVTSAVPSPPSGGIKAAALILFAFMGIPQAVAFSIPFALAAIFSNDSGAGLGLSMGVLNLAFVIPQLVVSLTIGPFDELFGGGNLPAFAVGSIAAAASGILAFTLLPSPPLDAPAKPIANGFH